VQLTVLEFAPPAVSAVVAHVGLFGPVMFHVIDPVGATAPVGPATVVVNVTDVPGDALAGDDATETVGVDFATVAVPLPLVAV
jgi:hypothetical protein